MSALRTRARRNPAPGHLNAHVADAPAPGARQVPVRPGRCLVVVGVTMAAMRPALRIADAVPTRATVIALPPAAEGLKTGLARYDPVVAVMAAGAVVRILAPLIAAGDKSSDPAILVVDDAGRFVMPILGGTAAQANRLANALAEILGAVAVVTTATELAGVPGRGQPGGPVGGGVVGGGAPGGVDVPGRRPGGMTTGGWSGKPIFVLMGTKDMLETLTHHDELLADPMSKRSEQPEFATNPNRSARSEFLVLIGLCTHLGCIPTFRPTPGAPDIGASWPGGFYCPCHGSKFDLAGRVFKSVPAPTNLEVPPYEFESNATLLIGVNPKA